MPAEAKVTREQIVNGALALVRRGGEAALTAKALAAELSCSTQPIFWHFSTMEELRGAVYEAALGVFGEHLRRPQEGVSPYMAVGLNYISFASEESALFRLLFMSDFGQTDVLGAHVEMEYILGVIEESEGLTGIAAETLYRDMWLFSHGIAAMTATGTAAFGKEEVRAMLSDVCRGLIAKFRQEQEKNR